MAPGRYGQLQIDRFRHLSTQGWIYFNCSYVSSLLRPEVYRSLGLEKEINTFFRLHSPSVIATLRDAFPDLPEEPEPRVVFLKLRELRNSW